jgi:hypothetical protein
LARVGLINCADGFVDRIGRRHLERSEHFAPAPCKVSGRLHAEAIAETMEAFAAGRIIRVATNS